MLRVIRFAPAAVLALFLLLLLVVGTPLQGAADVGSSERHHHADSSSSPLVWDDRGVPVVRTREEADRLLAEFPLSQQSWPTWRSWLVAWMGKSNPATLHANLASRRFLVEQVDEGGELPQWMSRDALAWYLVGLAHLNGEVDATLTPHQRAVAAELPLLRSAQLNPRFSRAHRSLGLVYLWMSGGTNERVRQRGEKHLAFAKKLNPSLPLSAVRAQAAAAEDDLDRAIKYLQQAMAEEPARAEEYGIELAEYYVRRGKEAQSNDAKSMLEAVAQLAQRFPSAGRLACYNSFALLTLGETSAAAAELSRADRLGTPVESVFPAEVAQTLREATKPNYWWPAAVVAGGTLSVFYLCVIGAMVVAAFVLARFTRGTDALKLMRQDGRCIVLQDGRVLRTRAETWLSRIYVMALLTGLALFYISIPCITVGIVYGTAAALQAIMLLPRIPIKLLVLIPLGGLGMAYGVLKSLLARPVVEPQGVYKNAADEPRLHELTTEVARQVNTKPVDQIFLTPGSEIGVYQVGRGPFGIFGVKRRVLTLGVASLQFLSIAELRAILAHEYAHFSHGDTWIGRLVHQLSTTVRMSLQAMADAGGRLNYVNPFYWFLVLYYKAFNMMASGFSRSREFLADRVAVSLYGANVFSMALCKVIMHGTYYEMQLNDYMASCMSRLRENESLALPTLGVGRAGNFYACSRKSEQESRNDPQRLSDVKQLLSQRGSLFASHPTIHERLEAVAGFANQDTSEMVPARSLLVDPERVEAQLTRFMQDHVDQLGRLAIAG